MPNEPQHPASRTAFDTDLTTIVCPYDFSVADDTVLKFAASMDTAVERIYIVHVLAPLNPVTVNLISPTIRRAEAKQEAIQLIEERLSQVALSDSIKYVPIIRFGDAAREIADAAEELSADLVMLPTRSHDWLAHMLLGSVTERVLRFARCPVLVLPPAGAETILNN